MRKTLLLIIVGLGLSLLLSAMMWPEGFFDKMKARLSSYHDLLPFEKVYLQSDKMHYRAGETVWLAGYVRDLQDFAAPGQSEVLHVELRDSRGNAIENRGFALKDGNAEGSLELPKSLSTGNYQLRAYTIWQLNEKNPAIFQKQIFVKGMDQGQKEAARPSAKSYKLDLLPEGGWLVLGLQSKVAFKVTDPQGLPLDVEGLLKDPQGQVMRSFSSAIDGMGTFELRPESGEYTVEITRPEGLALSKKLPSALPEGIVLRLEETGDEIARISIQSSRPRRLRLSLQQGEKIAFATTTDVTSGENSLRIPLRDMQMGIARLSIFDEAERPLAERLLYVQAGKRLNIEVQTDKESYGPREEVKLSLTVSDEVGRPCAADLSLSAIEAQLADASAGLGSDIISWLTLESELNGRIYQPQKYIDSHSNSKLDYLLMTHGWRRYDWQQLLQDDPQAPALRAEQLALSGQVLNASNRQPISGAQVMLNDAELVIQTDAAGRFVLPHPQPWRAVTLHISAPGFGTQQQRIIGLPMDLRYELQVRPVITPATAERLRSKAPGIQTALQQTAHLIEQKMPDTSAESFLPFFWPVQQKEVFAAASPMELEQDFNIETSTLNIKTVDIYGFGRVPVFPEDPNLQSVTQFDDKEIAHLGTRGVNNLVALSAAIYQPDAESNAISIRGGLPSSTQYIVDGVKVRGGVDLPREAMDKVQIYLGGAPAEYGDFTGGVVVVESKGPRMMWMMDTVATIAFAPRATNLEEVLSGVSPLSDGQLARCEFVVFVDEKGNYLRHKILYSSDRSWTKKVKSQLENLRFEPAMTTAGTPYAYHVNMPFYFYADDELAKDHLTDTLNLPDLRGNGTFYAARSFYEPSAAELKGKSDERTTLYWKGHIQVPASGRLTVRFRTSDVATRFRVQLEGIGENGLLGMVKQD